MSEEVKNLTLQEKFMSSKDYNAFVELVFERIQYSNMLFYFLLFFIFSYLFYGTFFITLGAISGSESDGQQFVLPILVILFLSLYVGYHVVQYPEYQLNQFFSYLPFTSPVVCMIKLAQGYPIGEAYQLFVSLIILIISSFLLLSIANRFYNNGILQFGHRLKLKHFFNWIKRD
jgi:ABC-2 type transport system permease protein